MYLNLTTMVVISLMEGVGIFMLVPMLHLVGLFQSDAVSMPLVDWLLRPLDGLPTDWLLPAILLLFVALLTGQAWLQRFQTNMNMAIQQGYIRHLRMEIYEGLLQANWSFFLRKRKSDFNHIMTNELARVTSGTYLTLRITTTILFTIVQLVFAFWLSWKLTAFVLLCGAALALYSKKFVRRSQQLGERATHLSEHYMASVTDHFNGIKEIKSNRMEQQHVHWFRQLCMRMERNFVQFARLQSASQFRYKIASAVIISLFVYLSVAFFKVGIEQLAVIILIFSRLWPKLSGLQNHWEQIAQSIPAFRSLLQLQRETAEAQEGRAENAASSPVDIAKPRGGVQRPVPASPAEQDKLEIREALACRHLRFRYDRNDAAYALRNVSVSIPANRMTAVVGKSGAGKSTFIDILIGLMNPESGEVLVDGVPLTASMALRLRNSVSYVSQDPFLFHGSIRENLAIAAPQASEEEMWEALRFSVSDGFVRELPQGLDTVIGDRGIRLSGGERQRIVLARAMLRKPSVLVLDEATSALDTENEKKIQQAIEQLKGKMTIIVIAHRLSTIRNADQVVVMDQGTVVQQGNYQALAADGAGVFQRLLAYQAQ
nr:ABC transporter ATP-binding protein [Xylanibacillus composti]